MDKQQKTKFNAGLITGLALGSTLSYFSTPAGKKTWQKLAKEWEKAKVWLYEQKLIDDPDLSLDEFKEQLGLNLRQSLLAAKDSLDLIKLNLDQAKQKKSQRRRKLRQQKKKKFKGI